MKISPQQFASTFDESLTRIVSFGFSGAALIAYHENVLVRKGYGLADRQYQVPNTPETMFSLGSVTKQFTAAAIMKLAEMGELSPDDFIGKHTGGVPEDKSGITVHIERDRGREKCRRRRPRICAGLDDAFPSRRRSTRWLPHPSWLFSRT